MILHRPLTADERRVSQKNYGLYNFVNGASYLCLGENVLILFATRLEAPNAVVALLGSMLFLGYLLLPLGVARTAKVGAAISQADFWVCRNIAALLTAAAAPAAWFLPDHLPLAWGMVLLGAFLFYGCRAAGCVLSTPLVGDFSTREEAPLVIGRAQALFYSSGVVMIVVVTLLTKQFPGLWSLAGIIVFGACCGVTSSTFLRNIHETGALQDAARAPLLPGIPAAFRNPDLRRLTVGWFGLSLGKLLLVPLSILAVKRGCGFSDSAALLCAVALTVGNCLISQGSGPVCQRLGPRKLLLLAFGANFLALALWLLLPADASPALAWCAIVPLFFALGGIDTAGVNACNSYFLMVCPDKSKQVSGAISLNLVTGAGAGLLGAALGPWLIHRSETWAPSCGAFFQGPLGPFRLYFALLFPILLVFLFAILRMRTVLYEFRERHGDEEVARAAHLGRHSRH